MIKSFAKINLSLRVLKKMKSGLHDIESNITLVKLHDKISVNKTTSSRDKIIFRGKFKKFIKKNDNSIKSTLEILRNLKITNNYFKIVVDKNIPVFAGLGGGTSNSAFLFKHFFKKKVSKKIMNIFIKKIGTDFKLFFKNQCFQKNLNNIVSYKERYQFYMLLIYPRIKCSTKYVYSKIKKTNFSRNTRNIRYENIKLKNKFIEFLKKDTNDLQYVAQKKFPKIKHLLSYISQLKGCVFSRMTGSGSVCYGVFNQKKLASLALVRAKRKYPKFWCVISKTI